MARARTAVERVWTPVELIRWTERYLREKGFEDARLNAELLLAGVLGLKRLDLYLQFERPLTRAELEEFKSRLRRRLRREPLQYIAGTATFRELELRVDPRVLIPRPETEVLVGEVLEWSRGCEGLDVLDVGTGSGAIALSLAREGAFGRIVATDLSEDALAVARANAEAASLADRVEFVRGSLYEPVAGQQFDIVVSNPPYVATSEADELPPEVARWEPHQALFAGPDGLDVIRRLVAGAPRMLRPGGLIALEIGMKQAQAVTDLFRQTGAFAPARVQKDYTGRDRIVLAERVGGEPRERAVKPSDGRNR